MDETTLNLELLLEKSGGGDELAFRQLYDAAAPKVLGVLVRMLGDRFMAEDVLQDSMVQAWRKASLFDKEQASATTWIVAIARHKALDQLRQTGRFKRLVVEDEKDIAAVFGHDRFITTTGAESSMTGERLAGCFGELGRDSATCIQLAYIDGYTFSEIAGRLGNSLGTVKSWIRRGLNKLQECMQR
jgi:RNA polymerase sigma-70 factor (ECF subfamily)